ncbi:MAG: Asp-tRNA(Asn)/Glu-tRNA(Gln) amidotransferase subunit GatA [Candidatus Levyibacteriota bacterium]
MNLNYLTIKEARKGLKNKTYSSEELIKSCLEQIKKHNKEINAYITILEEEALIEARKADKLLAGNNILPLLGIPIAHKDLFLTKGVKTTASSKVLENYIPQYDATVVKKLRKAGAITIGKLNCDAWAHGSSGENSDFNPVKNPWNKNHVPGGSSSGSAASVACDMCFASTGTDTGGSIRLPASFCNVVGIKPTYGRVSRYGIIAMASSFDSIGHFTKTVEDSALLLNITAGKDPSDATTPDRKPDNYLEDINKNIRGIKIGVPKEYFSSGIDEKIKEKINDAINFYEKQGAMVEEVSLPNSEYAIACYYIIQPAEVSSNLARYDGIRYGGKRNDFGDEAKRRIMLGTFTLSAGYYDAYYKKAMQVRTLIKKDFENVFKKVDVLVSPTSPSLPWKLGEKTGDPLKMYLSDIYTVTANLAGIPGLSIPAGFEKGLPIGMQILGPQFSEKLLYQLGHAFEINHSFAKEKPNL